MKLGLFSVSYAGLWGQQSLTLDELLPKVKAFGYDGIMLMGKRPHAFPPDLSASRRAELRRALASNGLELSSIGAYTNFTAGTESKEVPLLDMQIDYVLQCARLACDLGANAVRVFTGYEVSSLPFPQAWEMCVRGLQACCDAVEPLGVRIGVQNHHDIGAHTDSLRELLRDVARPNCVPFLDAWSPALRGEDIVAAARSMGAQVGQTIVADYVRLPRTHYKPDCVDYQPAPPSVSRAVPIGEGFIDYKGFVSALYQSGFDGWVIYEMCSPLRGGPSAENLERCARQFVQYMKALPIAARCRDNEEPSPKTKPA